MNRLRHLFSSDLSLDHRGEFYADLKRKILARIEHERYSEQYSMHLVRLKQTHRKVVMLATAFLLSVTGCVVAGVYAVRALFASKFFSYVSLIVSDRAEVLTYWKEFSSVLGESLPVVSIAVCLGALLLTFYWLKKLADTVSTRSSLIIQTR